MLRVGETTVLDKEHGICQLLLRIYSSKKIIKVFGMIPDGSGTSLSEEEIFKTLNETIDNFNDFNGKVELISRKKFLNNHIKLVTITELVSFKIKILAELTFCYEES